MSTPRHLIIIAICAIYASVAGCQKSEDEAADQPDAESGAPAASMPAEDATEPTPPPVTDTQEPPVEEEPDEFEQFVEDVEQGLILALTLKTAIEETYGSRGELPKSADEVGAAARIVPPEDAGVQSISIEDGVIVIRYMDHGEHPGGTIEWSPSVRGEEIAWDCTGGTLGAEYRPGECR